MRTYYLLAALLIASIGAWDQSYASSQCPMIQQCDICSAEPDWQSAAIGYAPDVPPSGGSVSCDVYIANMNSGVLKKYQVIKHSEPGFYNETAWSRTVEAQMAQDFSTFYNGLQQWVSTTQNITIPVGVTPVDSAYDLPDSSQNATAVSNYIDNNHSLFSAMMGALAGVNSVTSATGLNFGHLIRITVTFSDGSQGVFEVEVTGIGAAHWEVVDGTLYDADGNEVFLDSDDYSGQNGSTSGATTTALLDRLVRAGYGVHISGDTSSLQCTWSCTGDSCTLNCG